METSKPTQFKTKSNYKTFNSSYIYATTPR